MTHFFPTLALLLLFSCTYLKPSQTPLTNQLSQQGMNEPHSPLYGSIRLWDFPDTLVSDYELDAYFSSSPSRSENTRLANLHNGDVFEILEAGILDEKGDLGEDKKVKVWDKINFRGQVGYVSNMYVSVMPQSYASPVNVQSSCHGGRAQLAIARNQLAVFRDPDPQSEISNALPIGSSFKILSTNYDQNFIEIEFPIFDAENAQVQRARGYVYRDLIGIRNGCRPWALDMKDFLKADYLYAKNTYYSKSPSYRQINLALTMSAISEYQVASGNAFSYCKAIWTNYPINQSTEVDLDLNGCVPGLIMSKVNRVCERYVHGGGTTPGTTVRWGGACGTGTQVFRTSYAAGFPILRHHNHFIFYPNSYPYFEYGTDGQGTDAEVACIGVPATEFDFANDSDGTLIFLTGAKKMNEADIKKLASEGSRYSDSTFQTFFWIYGTTPPNRQVTLKNIDLKILDNPPKPNRNAPPCGSYRYLGTYSWPRTVQFDQNFNPTPVLHQEGENAAEFSYAIDLSSSSKILMQNLSPSHYYAWDKTDCD